MFVHEEIYLRLGADLVSMFSVSSQVPPTLLPVKSATWGEPSGPNPAVWCFTANTEIFWKQACNLLSELTG